MRVFTSHTQIQADSTVPVRVFGLYRGQRQALYGARVTVKSKVSPLPALSQLSDESGRLSVSRARADSIEARAFGFRPVRAAMASPGLRIDSVLVLLYLDAPLACALREYVRPASG